ncbi:MAG: DNA-binding response regulator [Proteobacteria bacterium]|nr:MAG: DNA-binding response regulator [Pseudomonadota bacterium]
MNNITVLLVEDHLSLAETVTDFLELAEITVDYAADGITGLHLAVTNHYDALILDVMLPGIEGFEICQKVRKEARSDVPIIMLTARDQIDDKITGFDSGADDYLVKPFNPDELVARVKSLVRRHRGEFDQSALHVPSRYGSFLFQPFTSRRQQWRPAAGEFRPHCRLYSQSQS